MVVSPAVLHLFSHRWYNLSTIPWCPVSCETTSSASLIQSALWLAVGGLHRLMHAYHQTLQLWHIQQQGLELIQHSPHNACNYLVSSSSSSLWIMYLMTLPPFESAFCFNENTVSSASGTQALLVCQLVQPVPGLCTNLLTVGWSLLPTVLDLTPAHSTEMASGFESLQHRVCG